ncbi:MAG TPA: pirin family protein [Gemmatimonadaceae bacterium]|nr:pirin family protein [Gemmatimonadaceae bacterium]
MNRAIEGFVTGLPHHWVGDGFRVSNYFPGATDALKRMSPFFLLDYHSPHEYAPTDRRRGVGTHPHRGFETVTLAFSGAIAHRDSAGNGGIIRPGETQWMTAGAGVLHNEYHEAEWAKTGGVMHMMQIWVNLPRAHKRSPAKYQALVNGAIPEVALPGGKGLVRVIAGEHEGTKGAASTFTPAHMLDLRLEGGAKARLSTPKDFNTALLVLEGSVRANGARPAKAGDFLLFKNDGDAVEVEALEKSLAVFLSGAPIEEPLVHYGPFVMNSVDEINEAIVDYREGRFGELDD